MQTNELFLLTLFCCSACDGEIAPEEIALIKNLSEGVNIFSDMNVEEVLNGYVDSINVQGKMFLRNYLNCVTEAHLTDEEQLTLVELAIKMIEADGVIQYSEVKFFKKLRRCLSVSDGAILARLPDSEDYLLPDIATDDKDLDEVGQFAALRLDA